MLIAKPKSAKLTQGVASSLMISSHFGFRKHPFRGVCGTPRAAKWRPVGLVQLIWGTGSGQGLDLWQPARAHPWASWPAAKARIAERFASRSRAQWCEAFEGVEACFAPVLTLEEAPQHPHLKERGVYAEIDGVTQPMPAPRFSRTPSSKPEPFKPWSKDEAREILGPWLDDAAIEAAREAQVID